MKLIYIGEQEIFLNKYKDKYSKFYVLSPQEDNYTVEYVKQLIKTYFFYNNISSNECILFLKSETLTPIIQNMLLKVIEETDRNVVFISKKNVFLKTILSRMQIEYERIDDSETNKNINVLFKDLNELINSMMPKDKRDRQAYLDSVEYLIHRCTDFQIIFYLEKLYKKIKNNCNIDSAIIDFQYKLGKNGKKV